MIDFQKFDLSRRDEYNRYLMNCGERGCEYSFVNLNVWGRQKAAFLDGFLVLFSQFERRSVYPFPVGSGDVKAVLDAVIRDARERGIVCRISTLTARDCEVLENLYPGQFRFHPDRDGYDYIYAIDDLAELRGKKFQKKRNHLNKFRENHPDCIFESITAANLPETEKMVERWYETRLTEELHEDFHLEKQAIRRAFSRMDALGLEGLLLREQGAVVAMAMGSRLSEDTFDIHFEKALDTVDGAYPAINQAFASRLREKYPQLRWLNREDDMGLPGLRKAKLSYNPDHMVEKYWARLWENDDED